jgi:hypothetical protein
VGSLAPLIADGDAASHPGPILAELHQGRALGPDKSRADPQMQGDRRYRMLREGPLKLVTSSGGDALLYDLAADPRESRDLASERPEELARMRRRLVAVEQQLRLPGLAAPLDAGEAPPLDDETRARLRALGYSE